MKFNLFLKVTNDTLVMVNCDYMSNAKRLLRALFMLGRVKRKRNRETCEAIYA